MMDQTKAEVARAYVRVSTLKDSQKDSPEHQEGLIREYAQANEHQLDKVYIDKESGTSIIERTDVKNMIDEAKRGEFNVLYFASLSRFSRDTLDAISLKRILVNALGIRVISIEDMYDSGKEDNEMIFTIISSVNQKQSESISISSKRGIRQSAKGGNFTGSIAPYGYIKKTIDERKTLVIDPPRAKVVQEIFRLYTEEGLGEKMICNKLNQELLIPSPKGGIWGLTSVQRILQNENYTGYLVFSKFENKKVYEDVTDMHNRKTKMKMRKKDSWERSSTQTHEAIISKTVFDKACEIRLIRGGGTRGGKKVYINAFSKFIFCKRCGSAMVVMGTKKQLAKTGEEKKYHYFMCSKHRRQGDIGCTNKTWIDYNQAKEQIIDALIELTEKQIKSHRLKVNLEERLTYENNNNENNLDKLERTIQAYRKMIFELRKQLTLGELSKEQFEYESAQFEKEISQLELSKAQQERLSDKKRDINKLISEITESLPFIERHNQIEDPMEIRSYLMKVVDKIIVSEDGTFDIYTVLGNV